MEQRERTFRVVCPPGFSGVVEDLLAQEGYRVREESFTSLARAVVHEPRPLGGSLAARLGLVYVQDRSSMLPPVLLAPEQGATVLDMCSAPGSKTGLLAQLVGPEGFVFGNEPNAQRLGILRNNLRRLSLPNVATASGKGEKLPFAEESFPLILLDPPCSGWGTEDKHPGISKLWTGEKTKPLIRLQRKLLTRAAALLRPGGRLMYSTCTTNPAEDEEQAAWAADALGLSPLSLAPPEGFRFEEPSALAPWGLKVAEADQGQGFYLAAFGKPGEPGEDAVPADLQLPGTRLDVALLGVPEGVDWGSLPEGEVWDFGGRVHFLPRAALDVAVPRLRWQGMALGRLTDGQFRPGGLCRSLVGTGPGVVELAAVADLEALMDGRGIAAGKQMETGGYVGLRFGGMALGWGRVKSGRVLWAEKQMAR